MKENQEFGIRQWQDVLTVTYIYFCMPGIEWGWRWRKADQKRPYICEISKTDSYKIVEDERGFGKETHKEIINKQINHFFCNEMQ